MYLYVLLVKEMLSIEVIISFVILHMDNKILKYNKFVIFTLYLHFSDISHLLGVNVILLEWYAHICRLSRGGEFFKQRFI